MSSRGHQPGGDGASDFDVVLVHGKTEDGKGAQVLRARPGRLEAGEMRALESGRALVPGGQVVQLSPRGTSTPNLYDVKVEYEVPGPAPALAPVPAAVHAASASAGTERAPRPSSGPAQVATAAYRDSWDRTFGPRRGRSMSN